MLGAADAELLFEAVDAVAAEEPREVLLAVERTAGAGRDPSQFARDLLAHLRHLLVVQTTGEIPDSFVVTATDAERLQAQAGAIGAATLVRTVDELADALTAVREGDDARMAVEIALLKAARPDLDPSTEGLLRRIERLERRLSEEGGDPRVLSQVDGGAAGEGVLDPPPPAPPAGDPAPVDAGASEEDADPGGGAEGPRGGAEAEPPSAVGDAAAGGPAGRSTIDLDEVERIWPAVLEKLGERAPALAATFEGARPVALEEEGLKIGFPADKTFNKKKAEAPERREAVVAVFEEIAGERLRPSYVVLDGEASPEGDSPDPDEGGREALDEAELLQRLKSEFDAEEVS